MKAGPIPVAIAAALCVAATATARAHDGSAPGATLYQLTDDAMLSATLGSLARSGTLNWRFEGTAAVGERQQLRLSARPRLTPRPDAAIATSLGLDPARATWRYALLEQPSWALRLGLTSNLGELRAGHGGSLGDRPRFGTLPLLHVAGEGTLARRWLIGFDADALATHRGRALELGVRVSYTWAGNFSLFGGYRLSDASGEAEESYAPGFSNSASVGLWYRF